MPEERIAKLFKVLMMRPGFTDLSIMDIAAEISPYMQLEAEDVAHQERVLCLADFYNLREKLMDRERRSFQRKSELILQIISRPEAKELGLLLVNKEIT